MIRLPTAILSLLSSILVLSLVPGCTIFGVLAGKVVPPPTIPAKYAGLADQTVSVMVWAPEGTMIDFPDVRLDTAGGLQRKLQQAAQVKTKEVANLSFPTSPAAVVKFQENHPEYEAVALTTVAPKLGTARVIYVEIADLQTRSNASVELYRGSATATLKVVEVAPGEKQGKVAYEESNIAVVFPPNAREEGTPDGNDFAFYRGTVDALTTEIAKRFIPHQEEQ
jgi:hypothetical protein